MENSGSICTACAGRGRVSSGSGESPCESCLGTGRVLGASDIVTIPRPQAITLTREQYDQLLSNNSAHGHS